MKIVKCICKPDEFGFVFVLSSGMRFAIDIHGILYIDVASELENEDESLRWIFNHTSRDDSHLTGLGTHPLLPYTVCEDYKIKNFDLDKFLREIFYSRIIFHTAKAEKKNIEYMKKLMIYAL